MGNSPLVTFCNFEKIEIVFGFRVFFVCGKSEKCETGQPAMSFQTIRIPSSGASHSQDMVLPLTQMFVRMSEKVGWDSKKRARDDKSSTKICSHADSLQKYESAPCSGVTNTMYSSSTKMLIIVIVSSLFAFTKERVFFAYRCSTSLKN